MQNQSMSLVLSSDAKPRLKWTPELHQRFVDAISQLGGPDKATPKTLMRAMAIPGLTLYHLKSHLQKYRLGKSQQSEIYHDIKQQDYHQRRDVHLDREVCNETQNQINESSKIAQALQMQMEVQRKLHEQIEVQRHLQLRIEAQGKYLQSVLKKAQETLSGFSCSSVGDELARAELSQLVSMVDNGGPSSSISVLTDIMGSGNKDTENNPKGGIGNSIESSLTSFESSGKSVDKFEVLPLIDLNSWPSNELGLSRNQLSGRKRSGSTISDGNCDEQFSGKGMEESGDRLRKVGLSQTLDLNS